MLKMIGIKLPEKLIVRIKEYVEEQKQERAFTIGELVRIAVEEYLNKEN